MAEHGDGGHTDGDFASAGPEERPLHADQVSYVKEFQETLVALLPDSVLAQVQLNAPSAIHDMGERCLAHDADGHEAACGAHRQQFGLALARRERLQGLCHRMGT